MRNRRSRSSVAAVPRKPINVHDPYKVTPSRDALDAVVTAAIAGDESAFSELADRHRRELHAHCYRMLGSLEDSEDLVQETFLRAWRWRRSLRGRSSLRAWLYRIATNVCLDALKRRPHRQQSAEGPSRSFPRDRVSHHGRRAIRSRRPMRDQRSRSTLAPCPLRRSQAASAGLGPGGALIERGSAMNHQPPLGPICAEIKT
jgi:Sigma-70 region 2